MRPIRVLVVEDSVTVRERLCEVLASDPGFEVAGVADNGHTAIDAARRLRPDVITMDIMLPGLSGLAATEHIMAHVPTPILVVSSADNRSEVFTTYDALAAGAVDVLDKPGGDATDDSWERRLLSAVRIVSRVPVITHPRAKLASLRRLPQPAADPSGHAAAAAGSGSGSAPGAGSGSAPGAGSGRIAAVAIGASTGGPGAVVDLLRALPAAFSAPLLLVQHISPAFARSFVDWLAGQAGRPVRCAVDGELLTATAGRVTMAPADRHLVLRDGRLWLTDAPERHSCRPSVDTLFESVAAACGADAVGCLLTGMGRDGAAGLLAMRRAGALTVAQDEASCVVYGMPREAVLLDAAAEVLAPGEIGARLARALVPDRTGRHT